jgi:hypothetical protein
MNLTRIILTNLVFCLVCAAIITACQKLERPKLKELILDPPAPPYDPLKSFWSFENNTTDAGENKLVGVSSNTAFAPGITGQGLKINADGYLVFKNLSDTLRDGNNFVSIPIDTIKNLGSFSVSFWMNGVGPVVGGAQGLFSISHANQFWGNLDFFLENNDNGSEAFLKIHMFNAGASGGGEEWNEIKLPGALNKWTHIALTYNHTTSSLTLFVDGAATSINNKVLGGGNYGRMKFNDVTGLVLGTFQFQTNPTLSNHGPEPWAKSFNGTLDQVRLYNKALSPAEVNALFVGKL